MKPILLFSLFPPALAALYSSPSTTPGPSFTVSCTVGGDPCPTGSTCTQTSVCGGLCISSFIPVPQIPCTVGAQTGCPTGATCTPTMVCPATGNCGGACIETSPPTTSPAPLPTLPCTLGANDCPTGLTCTQTVVCRGLCIATPTPPAQIPCTVGVKTGCPTGSTCTPTMTCPVTGACGGACISATPGPTPPARCGGRHCPRCPHGFKCSHRPDQKYGHDSDCHGFCVPQSKPYGDDDDDDDS